MASSVVTLSGACWDSVFWPVQAASSSAAAAEIIKCVIFMMVYVISYVAVIVNSGAKIQIYFETETIYMAVVSVSALFFANLFTSLAQFGTTVQRTAATRRDSRATGVALWLALGVGGAACGRAAARVRNGVVGHVGGRCGACGGVV